MGRQQSDLLKNELLTAHRLISQVSRALFDPPYVIVLDRMLTQEVWLEGALTDAVGLGANKKDLVRFLDGLGKQKLVKKFMNTELNDLENENENGELPQRPPPPPKPAPLGPGDDPNATPAEGEERQRARPQRLYRKRLYYYVDYWEFAQITKYRMAVMRKKIEGGVKQEVTKQDYRCPTCGKSFNALDVASLMQGLATSSMDPNGEFSLNCDVCGSPIDQKMNEEEVKNENDKVHRFNVATEHIRTTLQQVDRLGLDRFDVQAWLMRHVPQTVIIDRDDRGKPIKSDRPRTIGVSVEVADEDAERLRKLEKERLTEEQRSANELPVWHTHSTVSGAQTSLGMDHEERNAKSIQNVKRLEEEARAQGKVDVEDADLASYYASLHENGEEQDGQQEVGESTSTPAEDADTDVAVEETPQKVEPEVEVQVMEMDEEDEDEEMEDATSADVTRARNAEHTNVMVSVNGEKMPQSEITEDLIEQMTQDEYIAYWRLIDDQES